MADTSACGVTQCAILGPGRSTRRLKNSRSFSGCSGSNATSSGLPSQGASTSVKQAYRFGNVPSCEYAMLPRPVGWFLRIAKHPPDKATIRCLAKCEANGRVPRSKPSAVHRREDHHSVSNVVGVIRDKLSVPTIVKRAAVPIATPCSASTMLSSAPICSSSMAMSLLSVLQGHRFHLHCLLRPTTEVRDPPQTGTVERAQARLFATANYSHGLLRSHKRGWNRNLNLTVPRLWFLQRERLPRDLPVRF